MGSWVSRLWVELVPSSVVVVIKIICDPTISKIGSHIDRVRHAWWLRTGIGHIKNYRNIHTHS